MDHKKITFRPFDADSAKDCELMAAWENDPEIRELFQVFRDEEASKRVSTAAEVSKNYQKSPGNPTEQSFMRASPEFRWNSGKGTDRLLS